MNPAGAFVIWKVKNYRRLWVVGFLNSSCRWLEILSFSVITWQWFADARYAAGLFATRMLALSITGIFFSIFHNQIAGQKIMFGAQMSAVFSCLICILCLTNFEEYGLYSLGLISAVSGGLWSVDWAYRRRMLADTLEEQHIFSGLSFDVMSNHATRFVGMILGGVILHTFNNIVLFIILIVAYFLSSLLVLKSKDISFQITSRNTFLHSMRSVFKQASESFPILTVLLLTPIFNIFVLPFVALIPLLYIEKFNTSEFLTGTLISVDGLGAIFGAILVSMFILARPVVVFFCLVVLLLTLTLVVSFTPNIILLTFFLFFIGIGSAAYSTLQSAIIYGYSQEALRSPTFSLLTIAIGTGFLGGINIAWLGGFYDVSGIIRMMSTQGFIALCLVILFLKIRFKNHSVDNLFTKK